MSRRVAARGQPHIPVDDPDTPDCCLTCRVRTDLPNGAHIQPGDLPDNPAADLERRRLGEGDPDA